MPRLVRLQLAGSGGGGDDDSAVVHYKALRRQAGMSPCLKHIRLVSPECGEAALSAFEDAVLRPETVRVGVREDINSGLGVNTVTEGEDSNGNGGSKMSTDAETSTDAVVRYYPALEATQLTRIDVVDALVPSFVGVPGVPPILAELASSTSTSSSSSPGHLKTSDSNSNNSNSDSDQMIQRRGGPLVRLMFGAPVPTLWREAYPLMDMCRAWIRRVGGGKCVCGCMSMSMSNDTLWAGEGGHGGGLVGAPLGDADSNTVRDSISLQLTRVNFPAASL